MAQTFAIEVAGLDTIPTSNANGALQGGRVRRFRATIPLTAQADGDTVVLASVPAGHVFAYGVLNTSATLGASTIAVGVAGTPAKYRAAAVFTTANTPTMFGVNTAMDDAPLTAAETVILTNTTAALPGAGTLVVDLFFSAP
jgi:hypothetical protein